MKILIVQQKMIGDVLTSTVLFERLKKKHPNAELHFLINTHTFPVVENHPHVDQIVFFSPKVEQNYWELLKFLWRIKKQKYDVVIDIYGKLSSNLISIFSGAKTKISYYKKHTSFMYTHTIKRIQKPENGLSLALENRIKLLHPLNINFKGVRPKIYLSEKEVHAARSFLSKNGLDLNKPIFMIGILGSNPSKTYPNQYMATLIDEIGKFLNAQILFNYIPSQIEQVDVIFNACLADTKKKIYKSVYTHKLRDFIAVTAQCNALIGNEGGAVNIAKALNVPTFALFCPKLNKKNWFGCKEESKHVAIHLDDFDDLSSVTKSDLKTQYLEMTPERILPKLNLFLDNLA